MMDLTDKSQLIEYLKENKLWAKHGLGQNFLVDKSALEKIIEAAELESDDTVIEVGPGVGTMTRELIKHAGKVIAVELDEKLAELLKLNYESGIKNHGEKETHNSEFIIHDSLKIINADILKVNLPEMIGSSPYKLIANIPYYITSKILQLFLTQENKPELIVMLVQKEVAERICAKPGDMSTLAISVQAYGTPEIVGTVKRDSFFPAPEVDSAILRIRIRNSKHEVRNTKQIQNSNLENSKLISDFDIWISDLLNERAFFRLVHIGFSSKRKTLVNNLSSGLHIDKKTACDIISSIGLSENVRAQELSLGQWAKLTEKINLISN